MHPTPSYAEFGGLYNVTDADARLEQGESISVVRSRNDLPQLTWKELSEIRDAIQEFLVDNLPVPGWNRAHLKVHYRYCASDHLVDRSVTVQPPDPRVVTLDFLQRMQAAILQTRPLWRILFFVEHPELTIAVYPGVIRAGKSRSLKKGVESAVSQMTIDRETFQGPQLRQMAFVQELLESRKPELVESLCQPLAMFDNSCGETEFHSLWLLHRGDVDLAVPKPAGSGCAENWKVTRSGLIVPRLEKGKEPFDLDLWTIPNWRGEPIQVQDRSSKQKQKLTFNTASVVTDSMLKKGG